MSTPFLSFNPGDIIEDSHLEQFIQPIQNLETGRTWYAEDTGSGNAFEVQLEPTPTEYSSGLIVHFKSSQQITGPTTLEVNGLGAKALLKGGSTTLVSGDIVPGQLVSAIYDGAEFQLLSPVLTPTVAPVPSTENVLVYSDSTPENTSTTATNFTLPSFDFDSGKSYLMEIRISASGSSSVRVTLTDGVTPREFPENPEVLGGRATYEDAVVYQRLPQLSGSHAISVEASAVGAVTVSFYEQQDHLVYADLRPRRTATTPGTYRHADFQAVTGHRYLLVLNLAPWTSSRPQLSCYLTDGVVTEGLPGSDPLSGLLSAPTNSGDWEIARILPELSGTFEVYTRMSRVASASVRIFDITS